MKYMRYLRALGAGLALAVGIVCGGCGDETADAPITMPAAVGSQAEVADAPVPVDVYWDATYSMQGYATIAAGNVYRTLPDELSDLGGSMGETTFYRFGQEIKKLEGREHRNFSNPGYYDEVITSFGNVIDQADASHLSIVVTDLFESDADWSNIAQKLKDKYFSQHLAVAIIGIKNPFQGDIFDVGLDAKKYAYDSGSDPARYRPFYLFIMGPDAKVESFVARFHERQPGGADVQYLVLSEKLADGALDFRTLKTAESANLYADEKHEVQDARIREFGVDAEGDTASLTVPFTYAPAFGALPVDVQGLKVETQCFSLADGEWQPVEKQSSDMKAELVPGDGGQYQLKVSFTPEKSLVPEKVNFVHVSVAPDAKGYRLPDWVKAWNMTNADVDPAQFDGSKTINFLRVVESLKASVLSAAHPSLVNLDFIVDE